MGYSDSGLHDMNKAPTVTAAPDQAAPTRIQSVARASQLLLWVAQEPQGATAKEIALAQGLALPTTYHLLNTLVDEGLLTKDAHRRYVLGRSTAILAQAYLRGKNVPEALLAALRELAQRTGETAYLADWGEHEIRVLASAEGSQLVRVAEVASGPYEHGHARANGKVLLAYAWPETRDAYLRNHPLVARTENTITDPEDLERELVRIRKRGLAYDEEEYAVGVSCVAAPLMQEGRIIAALGMSVPTPRFKKNRRELAETLLDVVAGVAPERGAEDAAKPRR